MGQGNLKNDLVSQSETRYSLKDKICPTFQNEGTATVYIDGRKLGAGESYSVNVPNVVLQNSIPITFDTDPTKTKILYVGYVELIN